MVYVIDKHGQPLMPTTRHCRVRQLLKQGRAVVVRKDIFTIQLTYDTTQYTQEVKLGVDCGSKHVGLSATTQDKELFSGVGELRTNITDLIATRRESRRTRRHRKTWHRQARFNNRVASKKNGWLPPSILNRVQFHIKLINLIKSILPVRYITLEVGSFDPQLLNNTDIQGEEYQNGQQKGFWNTREYVLFRDKHECQHCHGKSGDKVLNVHHIESRKTGGNAPNNLITLCETCHDRYHRGEIKLKVKRGTVLRDAAAMNVMKDRLCGECRRLYGSVGQTWGYLTKYNRISNGLVKEHNVDARVISGNCKAKPINVVYELRQVRRHNRCIHVANPKKGVRKRTQSAYIVKGFRLFDVVRYNGVLGMIFGRRSSGYFDVRDCEGNVLSHSVSHKKLCFIRESRRLIVTNRLVSSHD